MKKVVLDCTPSKNESGSSAIWPAAIQPLAKLHSEWWVQMHSHQSKKIVIVLRFLSYLHPL
jgi:hypothetical protein